MAKLWRNYITRYDFQGHVHDFLLEKF